MDWCIMEKRKNTNSNGSGAFISTENSISIVVKFKKRSVPKSIFVEQGVDPPSRIQVKNYLVTEQNIKIIDKLKHVFSKCCTLFHFL